MTTDEAREYFKNNSLNYESIPESKLEDLISMLEIELAKYRLSGGDHAKQMSMKVSNPKSKDFKFKDGKLIYAFIKIDGSYFSKREGISFNQGGFIGFAGEFSTVNTEPILRAFCKWCDAFDYQKYKSGIEDPRD